jgi:surfeit locus 1 family protein
MISAPETPARRFRPGLLPTLLTLLGLAVLIALGTWQVQRMAWKEGEIALREARLQADPVPLPADADPEAWHFRRVLVEGRLLHDRAQLMGAEARGGRLGHHLLVPLARNGDHVLVNRGWVPADWKEAVPEHAQPEGTVVIDGIARHRGDDRPGLFTPGNRPESREWYWYDMAGLSAATGVTLAPLVIDAARDGDEPPVGGRTVIDLPNDHLGYALTWYGLAAGLLGIYLLWGLRGVGGTS